jgi:hypothetical protein
LNHELIGKIAGGIVILSAIPYGVRVFQRKITIKITSWALWAFIGLAILLNYKSAGAKDNIWAAVFGFSNPTIICTLAVIRRKRTELTGLSLGDKFCAFVSGAAILAWVFVRNDPELAKYALCLALVADVFAAIPTIGFLWANPWEDRPFAWCAFAFAYGLNLFAISEPSFSNYILPIWMVLGGMFISWPLVRYRIKKDIPLWEWI